MTDVEKQLHQAGITSLLKHLIIRGHTASFQIGPEGRAALEADPRFAAGILYGYHTDVGHDLVDYRSHSGSLGKGSLQIVIDKQTGNAYADVDRFSPYSDVVGFLGHVFVDVMPGWFKRRRKTHGSSDRVRASGEGVGGDGDGDCPRPAA